MLRRLKKGVPVRQGGVFRVIGGGLPAVMPKAEHRAHHHVHLPVGGFIQVPGHIQKRDQLFIHRQRFSPRLLIDGAEVVDAGILMVDIEELVIFFQNMRNFGRTFLEPFCRISCIAVHIGDGIEIGKVGFTLRLDLCWFRGAARHQQEGKHGGAKHPAPYFQYLHLL